VRLEFHGSKISSNGGLLLFRELDEVLGLHAIAGGWLRETRTGHNCLHSLVGLLRQSVFGRQTVLKPVIERYADGHLMRFFRVDSAFAIPELYKTLETAGYFYANRLHANRVLQGRIAHLLKRPVGCPPKGVKCVYGDFEYQAAPWNKPRRVVAKVEWHPGSCSRASALL
jgi:hypothetical protein